MKFNFKSFISGALLAATITVGVPAIAKISTEPINAIYRNIKLVVDGVTVEPKDVNGNVVEPFIYNGTTYLPVRAVAAAFGKEVSWDGDNNIVYLGSAVSKPAKELPLWNRSYTECVDASHVKTYEEDGIGYIKASITKGEKLSDGRYFRSYSITYPLNTLAKTFSGTYYMSGEDSSEGVLKVYNANDEVIYQSPIIREATTPIDFTVNVENEISVKIVFEQKATTIFGSSYYIKNPTIVSSDY